MKTKIHNLRNLLSILLFTLILYGCSNDSSRDDQLPDSEYYIKFKVDGNAKEYSGSYEEGNVSGAFNIRDDKGHVSSWFTGLKSTSEGNKNSFNIGLGDFQDQQVNFMYTNKESSNKDFLFLASYNDENGKMYHAVNNKILHPESILDAELIYTEVNDNIMKGKFSGTLYNHDDNTSIKVTEGEFYVPRIKGKN